MTEKKKRIVRKKYKPRKKDVFLEKTFDLQPFSQNRVCSFSTNTEGVVPRIFKYVFGVTELNLTFFSFFYKCQMARLFN